MKLWLFPLYLCHILAQKSHHTLPKNEQYGEIISHGSSKLIFVFLGARAPLEMARVKKKKKGKSFEKSNNLLSPASMEREMEKNDENSDSLMLLLVDRP